MKLAILSALLAAGSGSLGAIETAKGFEWNDITPTESLVFHDCFGGFQCARLDVPMNWNRTDGKGSRVAVAIIKIPAKVPVTDERYGGAILSNPGGPGNSGITSILEDGKRVQAIVDATVDPPSASSFKSGDKYFDIISFDPRGMNNTTPQVTCFPDLVARQAWDRAMASEGHMTSSDVAYATKYARFMALGGSCTARMKVHGEEEDNLLDHMNTPHVVADMVAIIEALGEWREKEAMRLLDSPTYREYTISSGHQKLLEDPRESGNDRAAIIKRTSWRKGEEKLQYWGFSYGTVLGATFAALQPHRVSRLILDAVVDSEDYYSLEMKHNINDAEAVWQRFFYFCALAGPKGCPFSSSPSDTEASLRQKFDSLLSDLERQPIAVLPSDNFETYIPDIVTVSHLLEYILKSLNEPAIYWPIVATVLHDLYNGNGTSLAIVKEKEFVQTPPCTKCEDPYSPSCQQPRLGEDPMRSGSIWCSDAREYHTTPQDFKDTTLRMMEEQSPLFGRYWALRKMQCVAWDVKPKWKYSGIFRDIDTAHPILWIGTSGDPLCPLANAHKMSAAFPGSKVLEQASQGHCSPSAPSVCTARHIRAYFQTGVLPEDGTVCEVGYEPFQELKSAQKLGYSGEDKKIWDTLKERFDGGYRLAGVIGASESSAALNAKE